MAKDLDPNLMVAAAAVAQEFATVISTPMTSNRQRYLREVLAVTRAAAVGGEYRDAIKGYEVLGRALGHILDGEQRHVHLHTNAPAGSLTERTDDELVAFMRNPKALPDPSDPPDADAADADAAGPRSATFTPQEVDAFVAELYGLEGLHAPAQT